MNKYLVSFASLSLIILVLLLIQRLAFETKPLGTSFSYPASSASLSHPLSIEVMRSTDYPGSDITIEQTLESGFGFNQYVVSYKSEGLKINALLTVPIGVQPDEGWPVIIFDHGYISPSIYRTTERYIAYIEAFASSGYIVFKPDYRGHGSSEGQPEGAYYSPAYANDVLNALASIKKYPGVNPAKIGMWGHSMGGYITLRSMVIDPRLRAGVIWAGVVASYPDLLTRWRRTPTAPGTPIGTPSLRGWRGGLASVYGSLEENPAFYDSISANSFLTLISGPVQLHHGTADTSVPYEFSELLFEQLQQAGVESELYLYEGADHNLSAPFSTAMLRTIEFFDRHLKGG